MLLLILLEEVRCIPEIILCELYVVKFWEGMVRNSLSCHTISKDLLGPWNLYSFSCCTVPSINMLEDSQTKM